MAKPSGRERREAESVIAYWVGKRAAVDSGAAVTALALDLAAMRTPEWSHRFVIALGATDEDAALVQFGANFARLLQIPPNSEPPLEIRRWLPNPHPEILLSGCRDAIERDDPVLLQRVIDRQDGQREMLRCCFVPIAAEQGAIVRFVLGAYNSRLADGAAAPPDEAAAVAVRARAAKLTVRIKLPDCKRAAWSWRRTALAAGGQSMSSRRAVLAGALASVVSRPPRGGRTDDRRPHDGFLVPASGPYIGTPTAVFNSFRRGLADLGCVEGRNIRYEYRSAPDRAGLGEMAAELVRLKVDVLVAAGVAALIVKPVSASTPVVFGFSGDPVQAGLVEGLARPGGNVTGVTFLALNWSASVSPCSRRRRRRFRGWRSWELPSIPASGANGAPGRTPAGLWA